MMTVAIGQSSVSDADTAAWNNLAVPAVRKQQHASHQYTLLHATPLLQVPDKAGAAAEGQSRCRTIVALLLRLQCIASLLAVVSAVCGAPNPP
jgi:hypothetical protein